MIDKTNYEVYFIDYFDGKLNKTQVKELFTFLGQHPEFKEEFESFTRNAVEPDNEVSFTGKDRLKKETITDFNYKTWLIGYLEKDLSKEQINEVDSFLYKHPELNTELNLFRSTKLIADNTIIFDKNNSLRKDGRVIILTPAVKRIISVAAIFIFVIIGYFVLQKTNNSKQVISDKTEINSDKSDIKKNSQVDDSENNLAATEKESITKSEDYTGREFVSTKTDVKKQPQVRQPVIDNLIQDDAIALNTDTHKTLAPSIINNTIEKKSVSAEEQFASNSTKRTLTQQQLKEIFSDDDLNELGIDKEDVIDTKDSKSLVDFASSELNKFSKSKNIIFDKKNNIRDNSVTYALGVKNFSISHTKAR